jgi:3-carboxy-cis,cis-muconate cycloisomerase
VHLTAKLVVHPERMRKNLEISKGLIMSEAVMFKLAKKMGKQDAHDILYRCSMEAHSQGLSLLEALMKDSTVNGQFERRELEEALNPGGYVGMSGKIVEMVVKENNSIRKF